MTRSRWQSVATFSALIALASTAVADPKKEAQARELDEQAMQGDYQATKFKDAGKKLQKALKLCGKKHCSSAVQAALHRDLAIVHFATKKPDQGKKEMRAAVGADPAVRLDPDFNSPEVEKAFVAAGGGVEKKPEPKPEPEPEPEPEKEAEPAASESEHDDSVRNWLSVSFQQEFLVYGATQHVCSGAEQYTCFADGRAYMSPDPLTDGIYEGAGNEIRGGLGIATRRVMIGYDRVLGQNFTLGAKLGFIFAGSPDPYDSVGLIPYHAELRGSYWFGQAPFAGSGLRGYAGLAGGFGEVDGRVTVEYYVDEAGYQQNDKGKLDAWRQTGPLFVGLHAGLAIAPTPHHLLSLELRLLQMLPDSAFAGALAVSYALGL